MNFLFVFSACLFFLDRKHPIADRQKSQRGVDSKKKEEDANRSHSRGDLEIKVDHHEFTIIISEDRKNDDRLIEEQNT